MAGAVERIQPREPGDDLPGAEEDLDTTTRDAAPALVAEERGGWVQPFAASLLVEPEARKLGDQRVG